MPHRQQCLIPEVDSAAIKAEVIIPRVARQVAEEFQRFFTRIRERPVERRQSQFRNVPLCQKYKYGG